MDMLTDLPSNSPATIPQEALIAFRLTLVCVTGAGAEKRGLPAE